LSVRRGSIVIRRIMSRNDTIFSICRKISILTHSPWIGISSGAAPGLSVSMYAHAALLLAESRFENYGLNMDLNVPAPADGDDIFYCLLRAAALRNLFTILCIGDYQTMNGFEHFSVAQPVQFPVEHLAASSVKPCSPALVLVV
jgi:hypothetical protein